MLNIYCGKTLFDGYKCLMKRLEENRKAKLFSSHIFVVPDRFSMACEKDIFEYLNIESTFDIKVLTMSRFASWVIGQNNKVLPKHVSSMIVQKILIDNKKNLKCFHKTRLTSGFSKELFETINQLKSCGVAPCDIVISSDDFLSQKMSDIKFIYEKYEEYLKQNSFIDSADKFTLFEKYLPKAKILKDSCVYISHFDSFTKQGYAIVKKFIMHAKQVNIALAKSDVGLNSHIYLNDVYNNVISIANSLGVEPNIFECDDKLSFTFEHIKNNLFAYSPKSVFLKENNLSISCHNSFLQECEFVATSIKQKINNGARYKDIAVAIPNLTVQKNTLKKVFEDFEINCFFDISTNLIGSIIDKLIETLIGLKTRYYKKEDIIKLIKNPILNLNYERVCEIENYINIKNIEGKSFFRDDEILKSLRKDIEVWICFIDALDNNITYKNLSDAFLKLFDDVELSDRLQNIALQYFNNGYIEESKKLEQIYDNVITIFNSLKDVFNNSHCDMFDMLDVIKSGFEAVNISVTPVSVDGVFVGDSSNGIFERAKHIFVMGAKEGQLPVVNSDCGLINDREIERLSSLYQIEPSIKTINQRERFKLFNLLLIPTESLHISYSKGLDEKAVDSGFVKQLRNMFYIVTGKGREPLELLDNDYNYFSFCEKLGGKIHAQKVLAEFLRNIEDGIRYTNEDEISALYTALKESKPYLKDYKKLTNYTKEEKIQTNLFFKKGTLSVSEIERYYSCPFKHFIDYGLKLKENKVEEFDSMQVGNFLHKVAEIFVAKNIGKFPLDEQQISDIVLKVCDEVLKSEEFEHLKDNSNNILSIINIKKEAARMCRAINYQLRQSDFRPVLTEARFDEKNKIKSIEITVGDKKLKIVGAIDRIDVFEDYFRIIDYKTGKCDSSLKELFFGKKLQLYVYQYVVEKSLNLKPAGAYYFPVKNSFNEKNESGNFAYRLKGYTDNSDKTIVASDKNLKDNPISDIINVTKKKDGCYSAYSEVMPNDDIVLLADYAMQSLKLATKEIVDGNIKASPLGSSEKEACKYCPYKCVCRFDEGTGDSIRTMSEKIEITTLRRSIDGED